jgi:hypothetical protein
LILFNWRIKEQIKSNVMEQIKPTKMPSQVMGRHSYN